MATNYNEQLQTNNSKLNDIRDTLNALPDAGGSGSGGSTSLDTCTVQLQLGTYLTCEAYYTAVTDGVVSPSSDVLSDAQLIIDQGIAGVSEIEVLCGSVFTLRFDAISIIEVSITGGGEIMDMYDVDLEELSTHLVFQAPMEAGANVVISTG